MEDLVLREYHDRTERGFLHEPQQVRDVALIKIRRVQRRCAKADVAEHVRGDHVHAAFERKREHARIGVGGVDDLHGVLAASVREQRHARQSRSRRIRAGA